MAQWKSRRGNKVNVKGRNNTSRFVRLDYRILNSNAYRSLSTNARCLLVELLMLYNGDNNGSLYLGVRDAAHRMGIVDLTAASRAFDDLMALGFIEMTQEGHFHVKASETSRARCWRLTWLPGPKRKAPSWAFLECEPEPQTKARKRMELGLRALKAWRRDRDLGRLPVLENATMHLGVTVFTAEPVLESDTLNSENGSFLRSARILDSATHVATPWGLGAGNCMIGWWQPDWTTVLAPLAFLASLATAKRAARRLSVRKFDDETPKDCCPPLPERH